MSARRQTKAKKPTKAGWTNSMWEKVAEAQSKEITKKHGKKAAEGANYGWGDATRPGHVDVATKVYLRSGAQVISTTADYPSDELSHSWQDY